MKFILESYEIEDWLQKMNDARFFNDMTEEVLDEIAQRFSHFLLISGITQKEYNAIFDFNRLNEKEIDKNIFKDNIFTNSFIQCLKTLVMKFDLSPKWLLLNDGTHTNTSESIIDIMKYLLSAPIIKLKEIGNRVEKELQENRISIEELSSVLNFNKEIVLRIITGECRDVNVLVYVFIFLHTKYDININYIITGIDKDFLLECSKNSDNKEEKTRLTGILKASRSPKNDNENKFYYDNINIFKAFMIVRDHHMNTFKNEMFPILPRLRVNLKTIKIVFSKFFSRLFKTKFHL